MAETPQAAIDLMEQVWWPARQRALEELADIQAMIDAEGGDYEAEGWDWRYYTQRVRAERFDIDESEVMQYLELNNLIDGMFYTAERLFSITFHERTDVPVYHPDVRVWEVRSPSGEPMALFYGDFFARPGKRSGAWMSAFRAQNGVTGEIPLILNNCNYNKPDEGQPALVSFTDATTLFHEFGHGLHGILSNTEYPSLAGTSVDRDFVEFPAQILEHWLAQPEILERFALHHETGEPMPVELLERMLAAATFNAGFENVEFLNSGFVDMAFHLEQNPAELDVEAFEAEVWPAARARARSPCVTAPPTSCTASPVKAMQPAITAICGPACSTMTALPPLKRLVTSSTRKRRSVSMTSCQAATPARPWRCIPASADASRRWNRFCAIAVF